MSHPTRIGYARCAASPTDVDEQKAALAALGCDRMYLDTHGLTGRDQEHPELERALADCAPGYVLVVPSLKRLVTSLAHGAATFTRLASAGIRLEVNGAPVDALRDDAYRRAFADASNLATELHALHTRAGLDKVRRHGRPHGARPKLNLDARNAVRRLKAKGTTTRELATAYEVSVGTIWRIVHTPEPQTDATEGTH